MGFSRSVTRLLLSLTVSTVAVVSQAQVICVSNVSPPPELPVYEQPPIPAPGYVWTPGYWASGPNGYFWVPGTWVQPPAVGVLWTPGYWGWRDGIYVWNAGYWGPHIGFYGGINYGFGYAGVGYEGGHWENGVFAYNRTVNNFGSVTITNVYEKTVIVEPSASRASFNGGSAGTTARPTREEEAAAHEQHVAAASAQFQHERTASSDKNLLASENHGRPAIAATSKPGEFTGKGVVAAREEKPATALPGSKPGNAETVTPNANAPTPRDKKAPAGKTMAKPGDGTPPSSTNTETKPAEAKPSIAAKPPGMRAKPNIEPNAEAKPPVTAAKPETGAKPPGVQATETKSLGAGGKQETGPKPPGGEANTEPKPLGTDAKPETRAKPPAGAPANTTADSKPAARAAAAPKPGLIPQIKPAPKKTKPD
jgi:WXXGXW repeat (2 copies)